MGWISNLMTGAVVIGVIAIAVYLYRQSKKGVKLSIGDLFTSNSNEKLETIATISTIVEIISLSLLGIERGVEPFSAFMRYTLVGFFELVATFVFLKASTSFQLWIAVKVVKDGKIDFLEALWIPVYVVTMVPLFIILSFPTYVTLQLYYESIGALKIVFDYKGSFLPWNQIKVHTTNDLAFVELGAIVLIVFTPLLNVFQMVLAPFTVIPEQLKLRKKAMKYKIEEEDEDDEDLEYEDEEEEEEEDPKPNGAMSLGDVCAEVCKILNYSPQKMRENMDALLGKNGSNSSLHPDIATGTKTAKAVEEELVKLLLGKADDKEPSGVLGYFHLDKRQDNLKKNEHEELLQMVSDLKAKISRNDPADDKAELEKELSGLEAQRLKVRDQIQEFTKSKDKIARFLKDNCSDSGLYK